MIVPVPLLNELRPCASVVAIVVLEDNDLEGYAARTLLYCTVWEDAPAGCLRESDGSQLFVASALWGMSHVLTTLYSVAAIWAPQETDHCSR
jgi:hypothetical protein